MWGILKEAHQERFLDNLTRIQRTDVCLVVISYMRPHISLPTKSFISFSHFLYPKANNAARDRKWQGVRQHLKFPQLESSSSLLESHKQNCNSSSLSPKATMLRDRGWHGVRQHLVLSHCTVHLTKIESTLQRHLGIGGGPSYVNGMPTCVHSCHMWPYHKFHISLLSFSHLFFRNPTHCMVSRVPTFLCHATQMFAHSRTQCFHTCSIVHTMIDIILHLDCATTTQINTVTLVEKISFHPTCCWSCSPRCVWSAQHMRQRVSLWLLSWSHKLSNDSHILPADSHDVLGMPIAFAWHTQLRPAQ